MATPSALDKIRSLQDQIAKEVEAVKTELAKQLAKACETLKTVRELQKPGAQDVLREPQFAEYCECLGIGQMQLATSTWRAGAGGGSGKAPRVKKAELEAAIFAALKDGAKSHSDIKAAVGHIYSALGKPAANQFAKLDALVQEKKLSKTGSGKAAKYALK